MRDILDPTDNWVGSPSRGAFSFSNKAPVAVDDTLAVVKDSGPVTVNVLANDFDPEGQPLTLVSATAALGTAVAETNNTVSYTPPAGLTGFDTVVYEIEDDQGQIRSGQVTVTITEPQLSISVETNNTLTVTAETGVIDITVTDPPEFAGNWQIDTGDLLTGPVNLVPPDITGLVATDEVLTAQSGLWVYDIGSGSPMQGWQWRRGGLDISGATGASYTVLASDVGTGLSVRQTLTDSFGQRFAESAALGAGFQPSDDAGLIGWWDAEDPASITQSGGAVSAWANKAGGDPLVQTTNSRRPTTGLRTLNGRNVLDFDGEDQLEMALGLPASGDVAFHMVLSIDSLVSAFAAILSVDATNDFQLDANAATQFDGRLNAAGIGNTVNLSGGPFAGPVILSLIFDQSGSGTGEVYIANTLRGTMTYSTPLDAAASLFVMTNRSKNARIDGAVAELIVTGSVSNRADLHGYLSTKWGVS